MDNAPMPIGSKEATTCFAWSNKLHASSRLAHNCECPCPVGDALAFSSFSRHSAAHTNTVDRFLSNKIKLANAHTVLPRV